VTLRVAAAIALAAVVGGAVAMSASAPASASTVPLTISLGMVLPGSSATASHAFTIPQDAVVADASWTPSAAAPGTDWHVEMCGADGCRAIDDLAGAHLAAGDYRLQVTVAMAHDAVPGTTFSGVGAISLAQSSDSLAVTGGQGPWIAGVVGAAACALGALLLLGRRRRDAREEAAR
jgi:LPXTG-motif cell wall-anchored protein